MPDVYTGTDDVTSLSSRRAWIEILFVYLMIFITYCRSPHGERGLKFGDELHKIEGIKVALLTESVD